MMTRDDASPTIAVVSPDDALPTKLQELLERQAITGHVVAAASAGSAELVRTTRRVVRSEDPDIVLIDLGDAAREGVKAVCKLTGGTPDRVYVVVGPRLPYDGLVALMRAGVAEHVARPLEEEELPGAFRRAVAKLQRTERGASQGGRILSLLTGKPGAGVTTMATNLAVELHRRSEGETLLLDMDLQSTGAGMYLGLWPRFDFLEVVRDPDRLDESLLETSVEQHESGLHFFQSSAEIGGGRNARERIPPENFRAFLRFLQHHYQDVVVDLGSGWSPPTAVAVEESEDIVVVAIPEIPTLRNTQRLLPWIERAVNGEDDRVGIALNRWAGGEDITLDDVEEVLEKPVKWKLARDESRVLHSVNIGKPIVLNGASPFSRDLEKIVGELGADLQDDGGGGPLKSVLSTVFGRNGASRRNSKNSKRRTRGAKESSDV